MGATDKWFNCFQGICHDNRFLKECMDMRFDLYEETIKIKFYQADGNGPEELCIRYFEVVMNNHNTKYVYDKEIRQSDLEVEAWLVQKKI